MTTVFVFEKSAVSPWAIFGVDLGDFFDVDALTLGWTWDQAGRGVLALLRRPVVAASDRSVVNGISKTPFIRDERDETRPADFDRWDEAVRGAEVTRRLPSNSELTLPSFIPFFTFALDSKKP